MKSPGLKDALSYILSAALGAVVVGCLAGVWGGSFAGMDLKETSFTRETGPTIRADISQRIKSISNDLDSEPPKSSDPHEGPILAIPHEAPTPARNDPVIDELGKLDHGEVAFSVPVKMKTGESSTVIARIGNSEISADALQKGMARENSTTQVQETPISLKMKMELTGSDFKIEQLSSEEQIVGGQDPTTWEWEITPKKSGQLHIHLYASIEIKGANKDITTLDKDIPVKVDLVYEGKAFVIKNWKWVWTTVGAAIGFGWRRAKGESKQEPEVKPRPDGTPKAPEQEQKKAPEPKDREKEPEDDDEEEEEEE